MANKAGRRGFGNIRQRSSGRWQASYVGLDFVRHAAPNTFSTKGDAEGWLAAERKRMEDPETWLPPRRRIEKEREEAEASQVETFAEYADTWLPERKVKGRPLAHRTKVHYRQLLDDYLVPAFGDLPLDQITPEAVTRWYDTWTPKSGKKHGRKVDGATTLAHTYSLGRAILNTAVSAHGPLVGRVNPFAVRGAGQSPNRKREVIATAEQLDVILREIRPEWKAIIVIATFCSPRWSEAVALSRRHVDTKKRIVQVRRAVSGSMENDGWKAPKSDAGVRDNLIPEHWWPVIEEHLRDHVAPGPDALLFPSASDPTKPLNQSTFTGHHAKKVKGKRVVSHKAGGWYAARAAAGCPELHFHDLRATGATLMAQLGATEAEIQAWLGDSTPEAARKYVRVARSRMSMFADRLSELSKAGGW